MAIPKVIPLPAGRSFGEPYETADGVTVVPVVRHQDGQALGVFVIHEGQARWSPVVDGDRIALIGVVTGLVAATLGCIAMVRQPPWPAITMNR